MRCTSAEAFRKYHHCTVPQLRIHHLMLQSYSTACIRIHRPGWSLGIRRSCCMKPLAAPPGFPKFFPTTHQCEDPADHPCACDLRFHLTRQVEAAGAQLQMHQREFLTMHSGGFISSRLHIALIKSWNWAGGMPDSGYTRGCGCEASAGALRP